MAPSYRVEVRVCREMEVGGDERLEREGVERSAGERDLQQLRPRTEQPRAVRGRKAERGGGLARGAERGER